MDITARLSLRLLGDFDVTLDGSPVTTFESVKVRALLAYLAVEAGRPHSRAFLAELLWPDLPAATALTYLRHVLAKLKEAIPHTLPKMVGRPQAAALAEPPFLLITRETVAFHAESKYWLDVAAFSALLEASATHAHRHPETCRSCARRRAEAAGLYRGDFLEQIVLGDSAVFEEWAAIKRERFRQQTLDALAQLTAFSVRRGAYQHAQYTAWRRMELDPWEDAAAQQLMHVLWQAGQRAAALQHYARYRQTLENELDVEPSAETTALFERIRAAEMPPPPRDAPAPSAHTLPAQTTRFIGREAEQAQLADLLQESIYRLITLSGAGGIGKTRLALQVVADLQDDFADGVCFVALASITDPALVIPAIAQAFSVQESPAQPLIDNLKLHLRAKQILLVLDNVEQVSAAGPDIVALLRAAPQLTVLVTSREVLRLSGEYEFVVPPLALPDIQHALTLPTLSQSDALRLFVARAQEVQPDFAISEATAQDIAAICHRLDGLPLAIELAAARIRLLSPRALLQRLANPLTLLTGGARDLPARQQTLRATIDWSYQLLPPSEQQLLARLAVFAGGWTLEAAEAICAADDILPFAILDGIQALVVKSLVHKQAATLPGIEAMLSFGMLETIRDYALERLDASDQAEELRRRHASYYLALVETAEPELEGAGEIHWARRLEAEYSNIRAALAWSCAAPSNVELSLRFIGALYAFWLRLGYLQEARAWAEQAVAQPNGPLLARSKAILVLAQIAGQLDEYTLVTRLYEQNLEIFRALGDRVGVARVLLNQGRTARIQGNYGQATRLEQASRTLFAEVGDRAGVAIALRSLGEIAFDQGALREATAHFQEAKWIAEEIGFAGRIAWTTMDLGRCAHAAGEHGQAARLLEASLLQFQALSHQTGLQQALEWQGRVAQAQGEYERAVRLYRESLQLSQAIGSRWEIANVLTGLAGTLGCSGQALRAARLFGAVEALRAAVGIPLPPVARPEYERDVAVVQAQIDAETWAAAWAAGRRMTLDQVIAEALHEQAEIERANIA
jgi:predicted ATPase/DNA-binding SARP family transcriptional activator